MELWTGMAMLSLTGLAVLTTMKKRKELHR